MKTAKTRLICLAVILCPLLLLAAVHEISDPRPEGGDDMRGLARKTVHNLSSSRTLSVTVGTGATTIAAGKLRWACYPVGGTCVINIGGAGAVTIAEGEVKEAGVPGFQTSQAAVVTNGTGTAHWSYQSAD